jgi:hypothetical protein
MERYFPTTSSDPSQRNSEFQSPTHTSSFADVPLWTRDGFAELRRDLDRTWLIAPAHDAMPPDGWWQSARSIEWDLQRFEATEP